MLEKKFFMWRDINPSPEAQSCKNKAENQSEIESCLKGNDVVHLIF